MKSLAFFVFFLGLFVSCGGEWTAADSTALSCRISDVPFTSAEQISLSADGEDLYILDRFNHVYVYGRNDARTCAFELFRTPENSDGQIPVGQAEKIESVGSFLYYYDGISLLRYDDDEFLCDVSLRQMAITSSAIYYAPNSGLEKLKINGTGCKKTQTSFAATRVMAMDAKAGMIATVETSGALTDPPQRLNIYSESGNLQVRRALAVGDKRNTLHFCSATRIRFGAAYLALLDAKCAYVGIFDLNGELIRRVDLTEEGIRGALDIDIAQDELFILTSSSIHPIYYFDFASLGMLD